MSKGWISLHRGDLVESLMEHNPNAFLLLTQIAMRARRDDCPITGLKTGEAFIGDFKKAGIPTQMKYRTAKKQLESIELVTFKTTNKGTIATLLDTRVYSTNKNDRNDQNNIKITSQQRADNDQITTKKNVRKKEGKNKELNTPSEEEFISYLVENLPKRNPDWTPTRATRAAKARYETYTANRWKDGKDKPIKIWKTKALTAINYEKPWSYGSDDQKPAQQSFTEINQQAKHDLFQDNLRKLC